VISEAHQKKLKIVDFIGNAIEQDIKDVEDHVHAPAINKKDADRFKEDESYLS